MTKDELIARQAQQIEELKDQVGLYRMSWASIRRELTGMGGPLNDNVLGYSNAQLRPFSKILDTLDFGCPPSGGAE